MFFWYLRCVLQCTIFPHTPVHHTLCSLLLFFHFSLGKSATKSHLKCPKNDVLFSSGEAKTRKKVPPAWRLQRRPPGAPPAGHSHQPGRGGGRRFDETTSELVGSSVLLYDAGSTHCAWYRLELSGPNPSVQGSR